MTDLNKLADALENIAQMEYPSAHHDGNNLREAAALLRAAAGVDVAGLIQMVQDFGSARWAEGFDEKNKPHGQPARHKKEAAKQLTALETALRLVLAQREDDVFAALDMSPETFRTEGGAVNVGKLRAAIRHPADYLPSTHWLVAAMDKGHYFCKKCNQFGLLNEIHNRLDGSECGYLASLIAAAPQAKEQTA